MTESPWQDPPGGRPPGPGAELAPELRTCQALYMKLMGVLCTASRDDEELANIAAIVTVAELLGDPIVNTGALWVQPDVVAPLRSMIEALEQRRAEPAKPALPTVRQFFASARPVATN